MSHKIQQIASDAHDYRHDQRCRAEQYLALAEYLPPRDRVLIEHILGKGMPVAKIAALYQRPARQLHRQANVILKRMSNKMFRFVAIHMNTLPLETRPTAKYAILHGRSLRQTAELTGTTLHHVRRHMNTIQATARLLG